MHKTFAQLFPFFGKYGKIIPWGYTRGIFILTILEIRRRRNGTEEAG